MREKRKKYLSLKLTFLATLFTILIFIFLFLFIGIKQRSYAYEDAKFIASEVSRNAVVETEQYFKEALLSARNLKETALKLRHARVDRNVIAQLVKDELVKNPNYLSVWTMWEHNIYDALDHLYTDTEMYDSNGNLSVAYFRYNNEILTEKVAVDDYYEEYYTIPKQSKSELFIEPYLYQYTGFPYVFYEASIVVPIMEDTTFLGVFAIDIGLNDLQRRLNEVKLYKTGYLSLITNKGKIISHPDSSYINESIYDISDNNKDLIYNTITLGERLEFETISEFTKQKVFRYFYPISASELSSPWSIMVEIPVKEVIKRSQELLWISIFTLIVGISLLIFLVFNIIDRRTYEREILDAMCKAEASDRLKTAFLNNISHEIRTPLNGIVGFTSLIAQKNISKNEVNFYKQIIENSSSQLLSVITNVIELSKIQTGQITKNIIEFDINKAIENSVETYQMSAKEKDLELKVNIPYKDQFLINSDENKFKQVLSYLLNNAIKFTQKGYVEIGYETQENKVVFYVKDTGIGISKENYHHIFNYFDQEDNSLSRNYGGIGAGLTISKSFIDILGGSMFFESKVNGGTIFYFTLPDLKNEVN